jgi:hypothetical protein
MTDRELAGDCVHQVAEINRELTALERRAEQACLVAGEARDPELVRITRTARLRLALARKEVFDLYFNLDNYLDSPSKETR